MNKPYRGEISNWRKVPVDGDILASIYTDKGIKNLGCVICGDIKGSPYFTDSLPNQGNFQTSLVVSQTGDYVTTLNSTYLLVGRPRR